MRAAVISRRELHAVPVHGGPLGKLVTHDDAYPIALRSAQPGGCEGAVVAPGRGRPARMDATLPGLRGEE